MSIEFMYKKKIFDSYPETKGEKCFWEEQNITKLVNN